MLELFFLRWFATRLSEIADGKGRTKAWAALGVVLWFVAEIGGAVVVFASGGEELAAYGLGFGLAVLSAFVSYAIVSALPDAREVEDAPLQF